MNETDQLAAALAQTRSELAALSDELDATNRGVVALYAELDDKARELREAAELKSRFMAYLSHEFRTPLSAIRSISRILLDRLDGPLEEEQERQMRIILSAAVELSQMVDDLLDLARVEAGRITVSPAWFELVDLFGALRGMFKPIVSNDVTLVFEEPDEIKSLYADDQKLAQILRNFISNALKFTRSGEVRVTVRATEQGRARFSVADTGPGIAEAHLPLLFQDFSQLPNGEGRGLRGSGLGLSVCRRFAELLGGSLGVETCLGKGSTFYVEVPQQLPQEASRLAPEDQP